jgi:hypothetical protein
VTLWQYDIYKVLARVDLGLTTFDRQFNNTLQISACLVSTDICVAVTGYSGVY